MTGPSYREGQQVEIASLVRQVRRLRAWIVVLAMLVAFASFAGAIANVKACESRHTIVQAGERILPTRAVLADMLRSGRITRVQYEQGLKNLSAWRTADCHWKHVIRP